MKWQFVADVHGANKKLKAAVDPNLPLALLGDNLNLVDFKTLSGIATRVLSKTDIAKILLNLGKGGPQKALEFANKIFFHQPEKIAKAKIEIAKDYRILAESLPANCHVLHGNVDWPELLSDAMGDRYIEAGVKEVNGIKIGFVSGTGAYPYSMNLPGETSDEEYRKRLFSIGCVDVLCTHFPAQLNGLSWDVVAKRDEGGGQMITDYIEEYQPKLHLFGHIHNPKMAESTIGQTKLKNVGGFRYHGKVYQIDLEDI